MKVELHTHLLTERTSPLEGELEGAVLSLENESSIRNPSDIRYRCTAQLTGTEILVQGTLSFSIEFECVKCLSFYSTSQQEINFVRSFAEADITDTLDLAPEFREEILLTFPGFPQCSADCAGLCPECGVNKNKTICECQTPQADDRWGGLDSLNLDE